MMDSAKVEISEENDKHLIKVKGFISENSELFKQDLSSYSNVVLDFQETTFINSLGIRHWVEWFSSSLIPETTQVTLIHCVPSLVSQFNMVRGFLAENCVVESLFANYYIEESDDETKILLVKGKDFEPEREGQEGWVRIRDEITTDDGQELVLDTIKEKYFSFLGKVKFIN